MATRCIADLVVDAGGRRSALAAPPSPTIGARPPVGGGRRLRLRVLRPPLPGPPTVRCPPHVWSRSPCRSRPRSRSSRCRPTTAPGAWAWSPVRATLPFTRRGEPPSEQRIIASLPAGSRTGSTREPIYGDIHAVMAKIEDRHRTFVVDGAPVATGVAPLGDSWACTNPSVGRGASIGLMHACALRDHVADRVAPREALEFATLWHDVTTETVEPWFRDTLAFDRAIGSPRSTRRSPAPPTNPTIRPGSRSGAREPAGKTRCCSAAYLEIVSLLARGADVLRAPGSPNGRWNWALRPNRSRGRRGPSSSAGGADR